METLTGRVEGTLTQQFTTRYGAPYQRNTATRPHVRAARPRAQATIAKATVLVA